MASDSEIVKSTSRGQITLPQAWRKKFNTDNFYVKITPVALIIKPVDIGQLEETEETLFDADRDNAGKGISPDEIIEILKKIKREQN